MKTKIEKHCIIIEIDIQGYYIASMSRYDGIINFIMAKAVDMNTNEIIDEFSSEIIYLDDMLTFNPQTIQHSPQVCESLSLRRIIDTLLVFVKRFENPTICFMRKYDYATFYENCLMGAKLDILKNDIKVLNDLIPKESQTEKLKSLTEEYQKMDLDLTDDPIRLTKKVEFVKDFLPLVSKYI